MPRNGTLTHTVDGARPVRAGTAQDESWYDAWIKNSTQVLGPENHADFLAATRNPATVHAMLEDYRAGIGIDRRNDESDRAAGRRIECPTLVVWSTGHHLAEQAPADLAASLSAFVRET